jgi:hypothetical protein
MKTAGSPKYPMDILCPGFFYCRQTKFCRFYDGTKQEGKNERLLFSEPVQTDITQFTGGDGRQE